MSDSYSKEITAVVLAGGRALRMQGQDKGLIWFRGRMLIEYTLAALAGQAGKIIINANRNNAIYSQFGHKVVSDRRDGFCGPLSGIASALEVIETRYVLVVPCDSPLLASDLASRLYQGLKRQSTAICVAHDGSRLQPVFCLLQARLLSSLNDFLDQGQRKIDLWFSREKYTIVDFSDRADMFININTAKDKQRAEKMLSTKANGLTSHQP